VTILASRLPCKDHHQRGRRRMRLAEQRTSLKSAVRHMDVNAVLDGQAHVCAGAA
jgi:hypothetical protein